MSILLRGTLSAPRPLPRRRARGGFQPRDPGLALALVGLLGLGSLVEPGSNWHHHVEEGGRVVHNHVYAGRHVHNPTGQSAAAPAFEAEEPTLQPLPTPAASAAETVPGAYGTPEHRAAESGHEARWDEESGQEEPEPEEHGHDEPSDDAGFVEQPSSVSIEVTPGVKRVGLGRIEPTPTAAVSNETLGGVRASAQPRGPPRALTEPWSP